MSAFKQQLSWNLFLRCLDQTWAFQTFPAGYTHAVFGVESDSAIRKCKILQGNDIKYIEESEQSIALMRSSGFGFQTFGADSRDEISRGIRI